MSRQHAIAFITSKLEELDDDRLRSVAEMVQAMDGRSESRLPRELTERELQLIEQSKEDFRLGRTLSSAEARASIDEFLASLGVPKSST